MSMRLNSIQYIRGVAAIMVALYHFEPYINVALMKTKYSFKFIHYFGFSGVDLFFIISGFVIWLTTNRSNTPPSAKHFLIRRLTRIFLPYLSIVALTFLISPSGTLARYSTLDLIKMLTLYPFPMFEHIYGIAWTLTFELIFYLSFAILLLLQLSSLWRIRIITVVFLALLSLNIYAHLHGVLDASHLLVPYIPIDPMVLHFLCSPLVLEFCIGIYIAFFWQKINKLEKPPVYLRYTFLIKLSAYLVLITTIYLLYQIKSYDVMVGLTRVMIFTPVYTLLIVALLFDEKKSPGRYQNKIFLELGNASYFIYLFHMIVLILFERFGLHLVAYNLKYLGFLLMVGIVLSMLLFCVLVSKYIEMPLYYKIVNKFTGKQ